MLPMHAAKAYAAYAAGVWRQWRHPKCSVERERRSHTWQQRCEGYCC